MVKIVFFAQLKEELGCEQMELDITAPMKISELRTLLSEKDQLWAQAFSSAKLMMAINHEMVNDSALIKDNDEVAFFPPVTGG